MNIASALTLKQLRYLREVQRQALNMSAAAAALHTSQPGVSRQIQEMEQALGVPLLLRRRNRVLAFTEVGMAVLHAAERTLAEAENIATIVEERRDERSGQLIVATSHLHARYTLRNPIKTFTRRFPNVQLGLLQADANEVPKLVESNQADIGIGTDIVRQNPALVSLYGGEIRRSVIMPKGHPLASSRQVSLKDIGRYPIVGYSLDSRSGSIIGQAFEAQKIDAHFVVRAADSDVIIAYVEDGLGLAIVPTLSVTDTKARVHAVDASRLFAPSVMAISVRRNAYLRQYVIDFIRMVAPDLKAEAIQRAIESGDTGPARPARAAISLPGEKAGRKPPARRNPVRK